MRTMQAEQVRQFLLPDHRVLAVVAHPDDETLGCGIRLSLMYNPTLIHITDGAPRSGFDAAAHGFASIHEYAAARKQELRDALRTGGIQSRQVFFDVPDQEAAFRLPEVIDRLGPYLKQCDTVLTHPYEGGHPDHDACAVAVQIAARIAGIPVCEFTSYHWHQGGIRVGEFLDSGSSAVWTDELDEPQQRRKRQMLTCFSTQQAVLGAFSVERERFRLAPCYDFARPPHPGPLYYELHDWGMTGDRFREAVSSVMEAVCR